MHYPKTYQGKKLTGQDHQTKPKPTKKPPKTCGKLKKGMKDRWIGF